MNQNSEVIFLLCSHLVKSTEYKPYEPAEWSRLAENLLKADLQPYNLSEMSYSELKDLNLSSMEINRIHHLMDRGGSLAFEMEKYESMGISVVTRADEGYPKMLKFRLGKSCPPLFYYAGNLKLAGQKSIGFVGSRNVDDNDVKFTEQIVSAVNTAGYSVVSGGARGVDTISADSSVNNGNQAVVFLADSMIKKIRQRQIITAVQDGQLLLFSVVRPDMNFTVPVAMMRNKYIYAQSVGTVVVRSDYNKGGTWSGATECIRSGTSPVLCWNNPEYKGNQELIKMGALPVNENWNGDISGFYTHKEDNDDKDKSVQLKFFE